MADGWDDPARAGLFRHRECPVDHFAGRMESRGFSLDTGIGPVSNGGSCEPGEVPDDEVNDQMGNPG